MTNISRGEAAADYLGSRPRYGPDSPEAEQAAEALEQLLKLPQEHRTNVRSPMNVPHESPLAFPLPAPALYVLIGAAGSGKTRIATAFPHTWRLSLDDCRERMADDFSVKFSMLR